MEFISVLFLPDFRKNMSLDSLNVFMEKYESAANSRNFENVKELVWDDAIFWFTDDPFTGIESVRSAFENTWNSIKDEDYSIENLKWICNGDDCAVCLYKFVSKGITSGVASIVIGRGTTVLKKVGNEWKVAHEHLSLDI